MAASVTSLGYSARHRQVIRNTRRREVVPEADNDKMIACDECTERYHSH